MKASKGSDGKALDEEQIVSSNRRVTDHAGALSYSAREFRFERNLAHCRLSLIESRRRLAAPFRLGLRPGWPGLLCPLLISAPWSE
jgi:hypothetical protein